MKTNLKTEILETREGQEANDILRSCVHCGFCLATCPTYQLLGDELDSPRGRIYLIKELLEGKTPTQATQLHLDRCLTCRSCESTCPSGVQYGRLVDIGRHIVDKAVPRSIGEQVKRQALNKIITNKTLFRSLITAGKIVKPLLPKALQKKIPVRHKTSMTWPQSNHTRKMLFLDGCVQPVLAPNINIATAHLLDRIGITLIPTSRVNCCGAVTYHLNKQKESLVFVKQNIDAWWPLLEQGAEAIVITASGCGTMIKEYGHLLADDPDYAEKAKNISECAKDLCEVFSDELTDLKDQVLDPIKEKQIRSRKIAFHSPCSLQHGQQIKGIVESLLKTAGYTLTVIEDSHLCCGSAGTYSLLQADLSERLLDNKIEAIEKEEPDLIVTANIGCLTQLQSGTKTRVLHWAELLEEALL